MDKQNLQIINCKPRLADCDFARFKEHDLVGVLTEKEGIVTDVYLGALRYDLSKKFLSPYVHLSAIGEGKYSAQFSQEMVVLQKSPSYPSSIFLWELWDQIPGLMKKLGVYEEDNRKLYVPIGHHVLPREIWGR